MLGAYNASVSAICFMLFLGFMDDVFDLRWRVKIGFSFLAVLPLLVAYDGLFWVWEFDWVVKGPTKVVIPKPLIPFVGSNFVDLDIFYHVYMAFIAVFCTNSINIYAGINGLETSQSVIIAGNIFLFSLCWTRAAAVLVHNWIEMDGPFGNNHILSMFLVLPFLATASALLYYNW